MKRITLAVVAAVLLALAIAAAPAGAATPQPYPYEVTFCWQMDTPDLTNPTSTEWPQHWVSDDACPTAPACEAAKYQQDTYWVRDDDDFTLLFGKLLTAGLTSPADDAPLEPHDYSVIYQAADPALCAPPKAKHASFRVVAYCNAVRVEGRHHVANIERTRHGDRFTFHATAVKGAVFGNGKTHKTKRAHLKVTGCGHGSGS